MITIYNPFCSTNQNIDLEELKYLEPEKALQVTLNSDILDQLKRNQDYLNFLLEKNLTHLIIETDLDF